MLELFFGGVLGTLLAIFIALTFLLQVIYEIRNELKNIRLILNVERAKKYVN